MAAPSVSHRKNDFHRKECRLISALWVVLCGLRTWLFFRDFRHDDDIFAQHGMHKKEEIQQLAFASCVPEMHLYLNDCSPPIFAPCGETSLPRPLQSVLSPVLSYHASTTAPCSLSRALNVTTDLHDPRFTDDEAVQNILLLSLFHSWYQLDNFFGEKSRHLVYNSKGPEAALRAQTTMMTVILHFLYHLLSVSDDAQRCPATALGLTKSCYLGENLSLTLLLQRLEVQLKREMGADCYRPRQSPPYFCLDRKRADQFLSFLKNVTMPLVESKMHLIWSPLLPSLQCPTKWAQGYSSWEYFGPTLSKMENHNGYDILTPSCQNAVVQLPEKLKRIREAEKEVYGNYILFFLLISSGADLVIVHNMRGWATRTYFRRKRQRQRELADPILRHALELRLTTSSGGDHGGSALLRFEQSTDEFNPKEAANQRVKKSAHRARKKAVLSMSGLLAGIIIDYFFFQKHWFFGWSKVLDILLIPPSVILVTYCYDHLTPSKLESE